MKRLISVIVFILMGTVLAEGEEMKFVTVLSSPVGTFAQLETANPTRAVKSPVVNFGTSRVTVGRMELKGAAGYIEDLSLQSGTELGGNAGAYRVAEGMEVGSGGRITGGRLMANEVDFSGALEGKSEVKGSLYIDEIAVAGAKAGSLTIPDEVELTASSGSSETLEWSNEYDCDYEVGFTGEIDYEVTISKPLEEGRWDACGFDNCGSTVAFGCNPNDVYGSCNMSTAFDYQRYIKDVRRSFTCFDIVGGKLSGVSAHIESCDYREKSEYDGWGSCPGPVASSDSEREFTKWKDRVISSVDRSDPNYLISKGKSGRFFGCVSGCTLFCHKYGTTSGWQGGIHGNEWYERPDGCIEGDWYRLIAKWSFTLEDCTRIEATYLGKKTNAKCKEGSPTYDSYLLKSKSTNGK